MALRAIRGATCLTKDDALEMTEAVVELLSSMLEKNGLSTEHLVSILFTATPDLHSTFPASAARKLDIADVPVICAQELDINGALGKVVRVMAHVDTDLARKDIKHIYLRGAEVLRQDIAQ
jgi:chorismate mutase